MANCVTAEQVTTDNTAHALCVLDNLGYRPTLRICNTYCIYKVTMVTRTRLNILFIRILPVSLNRSLLACLQSHHFATDGRPVRCSVFEEAAVPNDTRNYCAQSGGLVSELYPVTAFIPFETNIDSNLMWF